MGTADPASPEKVERAVNFVKDLLDRYVSYHDHKESMAFTGLTIFAGTTGASLVSSAWPPSWGEFKQLIAVAALTGLWLGVLAYLRFQLRRRRWAALRVAGCERVLAQWIQLPPSDADLNPRHRDPVVDSLGVKWLDFFWPQKAAVRAVESGSDNDPATYPRVLVDAWVSQEERGTAALAHERLIILAGWALYFVAVADTWLAA